MQPESCEAGQIDSYLVGRNCRELSRVITRHLMIDVGGCLVVCRHQCSRIKGMFVLVHGHEHIFGESTMILRSLTIMDRVLVIGRRLSLQNSMVGCPGPTSYSGTYFYTYL